jgi:hypothetical protein
MSTLAIKNPPLPKLRSPLDLFARAVGIVVAVIDAYAEALTQAHDAQRRYPFTTW